MPGLDWDSWLALCVHDEHAPEELALRIARSRNPLRGLGHDHPDAVVRAAVWLGIAGIVLSVVPLVRSSVARRRATLIGSVSV